MKLAIIGSRDIVVELSKYILGDITEIVSGGAKGVDTFAAKFALQKGIKLTEFVPQYSKFKKNAPLVRNKEIVDYADKILVFWDGKSSGTKFTIDYAKSVKKPMQIYVFTDGEISLIV